jgi:hypothetical protein
MICTFLSYLEIPRRGLSGENLTHPSEDVVIIRSSFIPPRPESLKRTLSDVSYVIDLSHPSSETTTATTTSHSSTMSQNHPPSGGPPSNSSLIYPVPSNQPTSIRCAVCLDSIDNADLQSTVCGHVFCRGCIMMAIETTKRCPLCRTKLTSRKIHPLYI